MARKKKATKKKLIDIELLEVHKENAHLRLDTWPSIWSYAENYFIENCKIFEYKGFLLWAGWTKSAHRDTNFRNLIKDEEYLEAAKACGLLDVVEWASKNYPCRNGYGDPPGRDNLKFLRLLDGTWIVADWSEWFQVDPEPEDDQGRKGLDFRPYKKKFSHRAYPSWVENAKHYNEDLPYAKHYNEDLPKEIQHFDEVFQASWKKARDQYKRELKKAGELAERKKEVADENHVERTQIRMKVLQSATALQDALEVYIKCVNDETMTVEQIGELYFQLTNLGSLNKDMKKIYGAKIPKK